MKKYELIKEYPGSPKIGTVVNNLENDTISAYPEFWKEVSDFDKNYEIMSFKISTNNGNTWSITRRISNGRFLHESIDENELPIENAFNDGYGAYEEDMYNEYDEPDDIIIINSVKRLSDGKIFTIGDIVQYKVGNDWHIPSTSVIESFKEINSSILIATSTADNWAYLDNGIRTLNFNTMDEKVLSIRDVLQHGIFYEQHSFINKQKTAKNLDNFIKSKY